MMLKNCFALILIAAALFIVGCSPASPASDPIKLRPDGMPLAEEVVLAGERFSLELALTPEERTRGLMGRDALGDHEGMLFVFPERPPYPAQLTFWMKNCLIPLDVVFIGPTATITAIHEMLPPLEGAPDHLLIHYSSGAPAQFAIELRGGRAAELGLQVDQQVSLRKDYLVGLAR